MSIYVHWKLIKGSCWELLVFIQPKILLYLSYVQMKVPFAARQGLVISESHILCKTPLNVSWEIQVMLTLFCHNKVLGKYNGMGENLTQKDSKKESQLWYSQVFPLHHPTLLHLGFSPAFLSSSTFADLLSPSSVFLVSNRWQTGSGHLDH